jgi:Uncharacterized conserved protein (COG2071)
VSMSRCFASPVRFLPMQASLRIRDLLMTSWEADPGSLSTLLPAGLEPAPVDGRTLVSLVSFHVQGGRVGRLPVLPYTQLNARTYVTWEDEPAVFFIASRVTVGGLPGRLFGAPFRQARIRVRQGSVLAPGLGVSIPYRIRGPTDPGSLGRHELGLFEHGGLRAFRIRRGAADWLLGELTDRARADFLVALGVPTQGEPKLLYTRQTVFASAIPPERVRPGRADAAGSG